MSVTNSCLMVCDFPHISVVGFDCDFGKAHLPVASRTLHLFCCIHPFMELELLLMLVFISSVVSRALIVLSACVEIGTDRL